MGGRLLTAVQAAIDLLLPPRCPGCGEIVDGDGRFCVGCWTSLRFITPPYCATCGDPFETPQPTGSLCGKCLATGPKWSARAAFAYEGAARDAVLKLKHGDQPHLSRLMGAAMTRAGADMLARRGALLVPVPLHRWRLWQRGYNQAAELARAVARVSGVELLVDGLERRRATLPSGGLNPSERRANVRAAFRVQSAKRDRLRGRAIILVDDVLTSGATADACARILLRAGAESVDLLVLSRVVRV